jgi:large conductance mechanosensitive channel
MKGTQLLGEFKKFALKGNVIDLAVAVIIGGAFGKVITSLVDNVLMPVIGYISPGPEGYQSWHIGKVMVGKFLGDVVNFLIIAVAMFLLLVKFLGAIQKASPWSKPEEPATKECPLCLSVIPYRARRCAHCTADLSEGGGAPA